MAGTPWLQVVQQVATRLRALDGYRGPDDADDAVTVYVGPQVDLDEDSGDFVVVAWPGEDPAGAAGQEPRTVSGAAGNRKELGSVGFLVCARDGDTDVEATLTRAMAMVADLQSILVPTSGLGVPGVLWVELERFTVDPMIAEGVRVEVTGQLAYRAQV